MPGFSLCTNVQYPKERSVRKQGASESKGCPIASQGKGRNAHWPKEPVAPSPPSRASAQGDRRAKKKQAAASRTTIEQVARGLEIKDPA